MDLAEITVFVQVVQAGSFTEAARRLGLPKSTVSRRVSRLEDTLGVRLLQRTTRTLRLTDAGSAFFDRVSRAIADIDEAAHAVTQAQEAPQGELRLTAPVDFGIAYLAEIIREFTELYPEVRVDIELTGRTVDLVAEGFDLALRAGTLQDSSLVASKVGQVENGLYASPDYVERRGKPKKPSDLSEHACILFRARDGARRWQLRGPKGTTEVAVRGPVTSNDFTFLRSSALAGTGIALLPTFICAPDLRAGNLVRLLPSYCSAGGALYVVYPSSRNLSAKVQTFRDFLVGKLADEPWAAGAALASRKKSTR